MEPQDDPVLRHARREAWVILAVWAAATIYCCAFSYFAGYERPGQSLDLDDLNPILGMPSWFFWGVVVPWGVCGVFTLIFAGFFIADDDLGADHAAELDAEIREEGRADG